MRRPPFYPPLPPEGAPRIKRLLFLRRNYFYAMAILALLALISVIFLSLVTLIVCGVLFALQAAGVASLERQIRVERDRLE